MNMNAPHTTFGGGYAQERAVPEFIRRVYLWMSAGLVITGAVAYAVASSPALTRAIVLNRGIYLVLILLELGLVVGLSAAINRISSTVAMALFLVYSAVNGLTLSAIFLVYTMHSIGQVFFISAGTF